MRLDPLGDSTVGFAAAIGLELVGTLLLGVLAAALAQRRSTRRRQAADARRIAELPPGRGGVPEPGILDPGPPT